MNKVFIISAGLFLACTFASAQERIIDTYPAHEGRALTMEEAIYQGVGYDRAAFQWLDGGSFVFMTERGKALEGSVQSEETTAFRPRQQKADAEFNAAGNAIRLEGNSIMGQCEGAPEFYIAKSEDRNIVYGSSVSRNEFGITRGYEWSPSGRKLAFYRKDESRVTDFPLLDITTRTGTLKEIKYPMNGMASEQLQVGVFDFESRSTAWLQVSDYSEDRYITNLSWSPDDKYLFAQVVDRSQHHMRLNQYRAADGAFVRTLLTEDNDAWIEPQDPVHFLKGRTDVFVYRTDNRDGYRNLYLVDTLGTVRRLTAVDADVAYQGNDGAFVYYTSAEISPIENHLFRMPVKLGKRTAAVSKARLGKPVQLTRGRGWHTVSLSEDLQWFLDRQGNASQPAVLSLCSTDGKTVRQLGAATDPLEGIAAGKVELGSVPSADGQFENYYRLIYPVGFDPSQKYPLIVYVYGGPHSQMVQDSWLGGIRMWEMLMAQKGYLVYVQDNRGTENRGAAFEKAINRRCGQEEMADQLAGIRRLLELPYVDSERVGVHGWSYGGFMTIRLMTTYPEEVKVVVAGGPVIDWKWYEIMYGERYMDNPDTNPEGFALTSLVDKAPLLDGRHLLICQGAMDNTVVWEHSLSFIQRCIDTETPVDYFPYPIAEHNVFGRNRIHLMDKVTQYFEDYL